MEEFTVDRFREEDFSLKEFLEEVYAECKREGSRKADEVRHELEKISEALEYKEKELLNIAEEAVSREEVEELANSLSSVGLSAESQRFLDASADKALAEKKLRFIDYLELAEDGGLLEELKQGGEGAAGWARAAEFVGLMQQLEGLPEKTQEALSQAATFLLVTAKQRYADAVAKGAFDEAGALAGVLFALDCREYTIDCLLNKKSTGYIHAIIDRLDLIGELSSHTLSAYLETIPAEVQQKLALGRSILMQRERIDEAEYSDCLFRLFKRTVELLVAPVTDDLVRVEDPFEYLAKVEYTEQRLAELKRAVARAIPRCRDQIKRADFLKCPPGESCRRELEGAQLLLDGLVETLQGRSTLSHTLRGEAVTAAPQTPVELVFRFLAVSRRALQRARALEYPLPGLAELVRAQLAGQSLLLAQLTERSAMKPFYLVAVHLNVYLCIKKMYREARTLETAAAIGEALRAFTATENDRSQQLFSADTARLIKELQPPLEAYEAQQTVEMIEKALKPLGSSPLFDVAAGRVLTELVGLISAKVFTRTSRDDVKKTIIYAKEIRRFAKVLELVRLEKSLTRLRTLAESLLVESADVPRLLESVAASPEETALVTSSRDRLGGK